MQKRTSILLLLIVLAAVFVSCRNLTVEPFDIKEAEATQQDITPVMSHYPELLTAIDWEVDSIVSENFNPAGVMTSKSITPFGQGTQMGICFFMFDPGGDFTMLDNGTPYPDRWILRFRQLTLGGIDYSIIRLDGAGLVFDHEYTYNSQATQIESWYLKPKPN